MSDNSRKAPSIRRIVTTHDNSGKSVVWIDAPATNHKFPDEKVSSTLMWATDETPTGFLVQEDAGNRVLGTAPPAGGTRFTVMEVQPGNQAHGLHRTDTIDYVICISGEIDMDMEDSKVTLKAGDIMIQLGTNHGWVNRGSVPCRLAVVLVDGKPKRAGSVAGTQGAR
jgi:mannose-6-phosphate isomerase-like protein (cupin superfamily)